MNFAKTYYADFSKLLKEENRAPFINLITEERRARIETCKREETKASLLASELLLREVLRSQYGITELNMKTNEYGKPYLADHEEIHFSLSHSGTMVICTISPSLLQCPPKSKHIDAMPSFANALASAGIGTMFLLEKIPCMRMTIGHLSVSSLNPSGSITSIASPP